MTNLKKLEKLTHQLELHENDFIDYVTKADYSIVLVSEAGRIKWCNDFFQRSFEVNKEEIHNKGLINEAKHTVKVTDLTRAGKLIHKKVTLISHE